MPKDKDLKQGLIDRLQHYQREEERLSAVNQSEHKRVFAKTRVIEDPIPAFVLDKTDSRYQPELAKKVTNFFELAGALDAAKLGVSVDLKEEVKQEFRPVGPEGDKHIEKIPFACVTVTFTLEDEANLAGMISYIQSY